MLPASAHSRPWPRNIAGMVLVQLLLPVYDANARPFARAMFDAVRAELAERHGGVTAYLRSPAVGLWEDDDGDCVRDDVVLFEVMVEELDREDWRSYRQELERRFGQEQILIRSMPAERL
jgi:hypothetical protein